MKIFCSLLLIGILILLIRCKSPSEKFNREFTIIDKSLDNSTSHFGDSMGAIYGSINKSRYKDKAIASKADSIYFATNSALQFMDSLKRLMLSDDSSGNDLNTAKKIFINSKAGDQLKKALLSVYANAYSSLIDSTKKSNLNGILSLIAEMQVSDNWKAKYFKGTPTVAAITIVNKLEGDCKKAAIICLNAIQDHLRQ